MSIKPVRDEYIIAGDLTFHYIQWGALGPPIIFIHGLTANAFCFQAFADDLALDHGVFAMICADEAIVISLRLVTVFLSMPLTWQN